jgi:hypothetical protein
MLSGYVAFKIEEIRCLGKKGGKKSEITYELRGIGSVKKEWERAQNHEQGPCGRVPQGPLSGD